MIASSAAGLVHSSPIRRSIVSSMVSAAGDDTSVVPRQQVCVMLDVEDDGAAGDALRKQVQRIGGVPG